MNRNESDWRGMNFNPKLLPGLITNIIVQILASDIIIAKIIKNQNHGFFLIRTWNQIYYCHYNKIRKNVVTKLLLFTRF